MPSPTSVLCDTLGSARNHSPDDHFKEEGRNETEERELGTEAYFNCTVDIHECFQPLPPPSVVANQSHLNDDSDCQRTKTTSKAQVVDMGILVEVIPNNKRSFGYK
jgi:hypothetical protein